jgi:hypothetical protein
MAAMPATTTNITLKTTTNAIVLISIASFSPRRGPSAKDGIVGLFTHNEEVLRQAMRNTSRRIQSAVPAY